MRPNRCRNIVLAVLTSLCLTSIALGADMYAVDPAHSLVGFTVRHLVINKVRGNFKEFSGTITYDEQDITKSSMQGSIKTASIDTNHEKRDKDLQGEGFFAAEQFPEITFASKRVEKKDDGYVLIGDMTMRDVTKEVVIPFGITGKIVDPQGKTRIGFEASLRINRQDFGLSYGDIMDNGGLVVGNTINIELVGEAVKTEG